MSDEIAINTLAMVVFWTFVILVVTALSGWAVIAFFPGKKRGGGRGTGPQGARDGEGRRPPGTVEKKDSPARRRAA